MTLIDDIQFPRYRRSSAHWTSRNEALWKCVARTRTNGHEAAGSAGTDLSEGATPIRTLPL